MRIAVSLGVLLSACMAMPAAAMTFMNVDYTCPIGGERFSASTMGSGTSFGHFLDGRQFGALQSPWPLVQCPGNGFVLFRDEFNKDELARLTPYVQSDAYQRLRGAETSYWLLSHLLKVIDAPADEQAGVLQRATWQASPAQYPRYVAAASAAFALQCPDERARASRDGQWLYCQMILGEWERRLSQFEPARTRFIGLQSQVVELVKGEGSEHAIKQFSAEIAQQLQLIAEGNAMATMAVDAHAPLGEEALLPKVEIKDAAMAAGDAAMTAAQAAADAAAADGDR